MNNNTLLAFLLAVMLICAATWPESIGKWIGTIHRAYQAEMVRAESQQKPKGE